MDERWVRFQPDLVARIELMTLAEHGDDLLAAELGEYLRLRAGRLDHDDLGFGAVVRDSKMLRPDAVHRRPAVGIGRRRRQRQFHAVRALESRPAIPPHLALWSTPPRRAAD